MRIYRQWAGNPKGTPEDNSRCVESVPDGGRSCLFHQCSFRRGHGPDGLYCKKHAKRYSKESALEVGRKVELFDAQQLEVEEQEEAVEFTEGKMVKVIDDYRIQYEKETGHSVCAEEIDESLIPKWEYVTWLEDKLFKATQLQCGIAHNREPSLTTTKSKPSEIICNAAEFATRSKMSALNEIVSTLQKACNEGTADPYWLIIDPYQQMFDLNVNTVASMISGLFFSREDAELYLKRHRYNYSDRAVVYCLSGHHSSKYSLFLREINAAPNMKSKQQKN